MSSKFEGGFLGNLRGEPEVMKVVLGVSSKSEGGF